MKPQRLHRVRAALYGQPWMITSEWLDAICEMFEKHQMADKTAWEGEPGNSKVAYEVQDGVAIVPLMGPIFPRANMMTRMSGATSAESFRQNFSAAMDDKDVQAVILQIDSPGGAVTGTFEASSKVFASRSSGKPVLALCEGVMASAAYLIGSQADAVYATEASIVGSIGVIARIDSAERALLNEGVDSTIIKTGKLKAIGNGPITDDQRASLQSMVQDYFGKFKSAVTRARPLIDIEAVSTGETWIGSKAQDVGLIDGITTLEDLIAEVASEVSP